MAIVRCIKRKHLGEHEREIGACTGIERRGVAEDDIHAISHEGRVLYTYEQNGYHDSDFYAVVWDDEEERLRSIEYATTRGWTYHNGATADATEEALAKARAFLAEKVAEANRLASAEAAVIPDRGKQVEVTRGKHKGATGTVVWKGADRYRRGGVRLGVDSGGERIWINAEYARVTGIDADEVLSEREAREYAEACFAEADMATIASYYRGLYLTGRFNREATDRGEEIKALLEGAAA